MSINLDFTVDDFENICRTCLCRQDLKPLYEKCTSSTCLVDMLMACTFVKFAEDDGLPVNICTNCIKEINQAYLFVKRCETTDTILRNCVKKIKTELANNSIPSQKVEPNIEANEEMKIETTVQEDLEDYEYLEEVKQEEDVGIEFVEVKQEEDVNIGNEYDEICDNPTDDIYDEDHDETSSENSDNPDSRRRCANYQIQKDNSKEEDGSALAKIKNKNLSNKKRIQISKKTHVCSVCTKAFGRPNHLINHMRTHTGEKPYLCSVCSKAFIQLKTLKVHMRLHNGKKPYTCEICNKDFTYATVLKYHMKTHSGEKPHVCSVCSKAFTQFVNLKVHMRIHTGEKPHTCGVCSKAFTHASGFIYHMRQHTGEKPYPCEICNKAFARPDHLKKHMRIHTAKKTTVSTR